MSEKPMYAQLTDIMDQVNGVGASINGQPYKVYRIKPQSVGDVVVQPNMVNPDARVWREAMDSEAQRAFEGTKANEIYWFKLVGDFRCNFVGDIFVLNDPYFGVGRTQVNYKSAQNNNTEMPEPQLNGFALAIHPVLKYAIGGRLDRYINICRPATSPDATGYLDSTFNGADQLVLSNGTFKLMPKGAQASYIPAGMMVLRRQRNTVMPDTPDMPLKTLWSCYTIPLPGYSIVEGDIITDSDGARYRVISCWRQDVGVCGNQMILEREVSTIGYSQ